MDEEAKKLVIFKKISIRNFSKIAQITKLRGFLLPRP